LTVRRRLHREFDSFVIRHYPYTNDLSGFRRA
jgi:hypothetical protein